VANCRRYCEIFICPKDKKIATFHYKIKSKREKDRKKEKKERKKDQHKGKKKER